MTMRQKRKHFAVDTVSFGWVGVTEDKWLHYYYYMSKRYNKRIPG
jgi:hypothetical protein